MTTPPNLFEVKTKSGKRRFPWVSLLILSVLISLLFIPLPHILKLRGIVITQKEEIQAPYDGKVVKVLKEEGEEVKDGDVLLQIKSPALDAELERNITQKEIVEHEITKLENKLNLLEAEAKQNILLFKKEIISKQTKLNTEQELLEASESLKAKQKESASLDFEVDRISKEIEAGVIKSHFNGTIGTPLRSLIGKELKRGDLVAEVLIPESSLVEALVPDKTVKDLKLKGTFKIRIGGRSFQGEVVFIGPRVYQTIQKVWVEKFVTPVRLKVADRAFIFKPGTSANVFIHLQNQSLLGKIIARYF